MKTFKVLAALLSYPEAEMIAALPELESVLLREGLLGPIEQQDLRKLTRELADGDLLDLQERYVGLFDRSRGLSLHLFEHVHGDSRDRGSAMVELANLYRQRGLMIARAELPDYLPLFLEYLAHLDRAEARSSLGDVAHILAPIHQRLAKRGSSYAFAIAALLRLAEYIRRPTRRWPRRSPTIRRRRSTGCGRRRPSPSAVQMPRRRRSPARAPRRWSNA